MLKQFYSLMKPGVLYGNALTTVAGFLLASRGNVHLGLFIGTVVGSSLVIGSACVINNYLDQDIDRLMARTKHRALISGTVKPTHALVFGILLGIVGTGILWLFTSALVTIIGLTGFVVYVFLYGALSKRRSIHGTLVGSVSGAIPILAGYVAAAGTIDRGAVIVFLILFLWQMPEFYSIAIYRQAEYKKAGVPVITVVRGVAHTKRLILLYTMAFVAATLALTFYGYTGLTYLFAMGALGVYWIRLGIAGFEALDSNVWAKKMFRFSLIILLVFSGMISVDNFLP